MNTTEELQLTATVRDTAIKPAVIRAQGQTPVILYGKKIEPVALAGSTCMCRNARAWMTRGVRQ